jgi:hypothetical protein
MRIMTCDIPSRLYAMSALRCLRKYAVVATCIVLLAINLSTSWSFFLISSVALLTAVDTKVGGTDFGLLDFALIAFYVSSCASTVLAYDISTAIPQLQLRTLFLMAYLICRYSSKTMSNMIFASAIGMVIHCIESIVQFSIRYHRWSELHFSSLVDFRSYVTLATQGQKSANYAAIYLITIIMCIYGLIVAGNNSRATAYIYLTSVWMSVACVLLSFSRALYLSALICLLVPIWCLTKKFPTRSRPVIFSLAFLILAITATLLFAKPVISAVLDTVHLVARSSQIRSSIGRLSINLTASRLIYSSGLFGAGVGNYALEMRRHGLSSPSLLTAHAFNTTLEIAIEQGLCGLATLLLVLVAIAKGLMARLSTGPGKVLIGGTAALVVYSMSQTYVIADQVTALLLAVFCATLADGGV